MGLLFNADEIFEMAEQIERNGGKFYRRVAEGATSDNRQFLLRLADMEDCHEKVFANMRKELSVPERAETVFDPQGEAVAYIRALANGRVFNMYKDPSECLTGKETIQEVLKMAIAIEKDSVVFYMGMKEMVPQELGKSKIEDIIREEMSHITQLSEKLASYK